MYSPFISPTVMIVFWHIRPQVISMIGPIASSIEAKACVAPNLSACSRLNGTGSIANTWRAPDATAPCRAIMPTPPTPMMATDLTRLDVGDCASPNPIRSVTPQPTRAASSNGMSFSILTTEDWCTVM